MTMQHFFLTREKELTPIELVSVTPYRRQAKFLEGEKINKVVNVHPQGVAWGAMYPRIFSASKKPTQIFVYKGRCLVNTFIDQDENNFTPHLLADLNSVPTKSDYRFQPFISHVIDSIHANENVLLTGGTGVGKTTHILQLASRIMQPVSRINFNGETRMSDLIGKMTVVAGETRWVDGVIPAAMRKGYWLLLDEIDFADPAVLSLLHPVLESDPMLTLKENSGEVVKPHPSFRVFATANSIGAMSDRSGSYSGTNNMNEAFIDRWQVILVDNLSEKEELKVVRSQVPGLNATMAKRIVSFASMARRQDFGDGSTYAGDNFSTRKVLAWAKKTALHRSAIVGAKISWLDKMPQDDQDAMIRILHTHFGGRTVKKKKGLKMIKNGVALGGKKRGRPAKNKLAGVQLTGT